MEISSINNTKIKEWAKLKIKKYRDNGEEFLIEGDHLVNIAVSKDLVLSIIAVDKKYEVLGVPFYLVTDSIMKKLSSQASSSEVIAIARKNKTREINGNVVLLDNIQDPGNLGAIIRSAVAFNIDTIVMSNDTVDLYNEKVIRSSEGMIFEINFVKDNLDRVIKDLKSKNYKIYGTDVTCGKDLKSIDFCEKTGIIIGNEGNGVKKEILTLCDEKINININNKCESLNASVAASIVFYELSR